MRMLLILFVVLNYSSNLFSQIDDSLYIISGEIYLNDSTRSDDRYIGEIQLSDAGSGEIISELEINSNFFLIDSVKTGRYFFLLKVEGYEEFFSEINVNHNDISIGKLQLLRINDLDGVTITASKPRVILETGRVSMLVKDEAYFEGLKAIDIISKLPGIFVSDGIVYNNGLKVSVVRINGIDYTSESAASILQSLSNNEIEKITLVKDGFSKEDASNIGGIIEIKTYQSKKNNHFLSLLSDVGYGLDLRNNLGISYTYSKSNLNLSVALYRNDNNIIKVSDYNRVYHNTNLNLDQDVENATKSVNYPVRIYVDYLLKKRHSFSFNYFGFPQKSTLKISDLNLASRDTLRFTLLANNFIEQSLFNNEIVLQYVYKSDSSNFLFKLKGASYSYKSQSTGQLNERNECNFCADWQKTYLTDVFASNANKVVSADFTHISLNKKITFNYGVKLHFLRSDNRQNFTENGMIDSLKSFNNNYKENLFCGYTELKYKVSKKLDFNAGIRYESTDNIGISLISNSQYVNRNFQDFFPSFGATYIHSKLLTISAYVSRKIERPNITQLSPSITYYDSLSYKSGNPNLVPTYSINIGTDFLIRRVFLVSLYHQRIKDYQFNLAYPFLPNSDIYVLTLFNYPQAALSGVNMSAPLPIFKGIKTYFNTGCALKEFIIPNSTKTKGSNFYFGFSPTFTSKNKKLIVSGYINLISPNLNGVFNNDFMYRLDLGLYYCFLKNNNLKIGIQGFDILNSYVNSVNASLALINIEGREINDIRSAYLKVSYSIGIKGKEEILSERDEKSRLSE